MFHDPYTGGMMWFGWIFWLIILGIVVWIVLTITNKNKGVAHSETPLEILKRRYAAGEINTQEYEERKKILEQDTAKQ